MIDWLLPQTVRNNQMLIGRCIHNVHWEMHVLALFCAPLLLNSWQRRPNIHRDDHNQHDLIMASSIQNRNSFRSTTGRPSLHRPTPVAIMPRPLLCSPTLHQQTNAMCDEHCTSNLSTVCKRVCYEDCSDVNLGCQMHRLHKKNPHDGVLFCSVPSRNYTC